MIYIVKFNKQEFTNGIVLTFINSMSFKLLFTIYIHKAAHLLKLWNLCSLSL